MDQKAARRTARAYGVGEAISVQIRFSQPVETAGDPMLAIGVGRQTGQAALSSRGEKTLWFRYAVQSGDTDTDGISIAADALALNGGSIRNAAGADAVLDLGGHAVVNAADHKVDGSKATAAEVSRVGITSRPQDGNAYGTGEAIRVWVEFSVPLEVAGTPTLGARRGANTSRSASFYALSTNGRALSFAYTVQAEDRDADGISIAADALASQRRQHPQRGRGGRGARSRRPRRRQRGGTTRWDGKQGDCGRGQPSGHHEPSAGWQAYGAGEVIRVWVEFGVPLEVTGTPTLALAVGNTSRSASFHAPSD